MRINAEFDRRVIVDSEQQTWLRSPMVGVFRRPLDRVGEEVARATSIVKYEPGSHFSPHVHMGGEEFVVLEGVFQDEHGDFPPGSYIRNPPQSKHTPRSATGCVIFVKLWQFDPADRTHVRLNVNRLKPIPIKEGVRMASLYSDEFESVWVVGLAAGAEWLLSDTGGAEIIVLAGDASEGDQRLLKHTWLRSPVGRSVRLVSGSAGARVWVKTGHLRHAEEQAARVMKAQSKPTSP
ncbi:MAG: cupin domain-containing protein [Myxococcota bacterium]